MLDLDNNLITLEGEDQGRLVSIIDSSLKVNDEKRFFCWAQCELQYLMPHEILLCGTNMGAGSMMRYFLFSSTPEFTIEHVRELCNPNDGLINQMMRIAELSGDVFLIGPDSRDNLDLDCMKALRRHKLINAVAHGVLDAESRLKSYFCFFRVHEKLDNRTRYLLNILLPILDVTISRVAVNAVPQKQCEVMLGKRLMEVLLLLKAGKSNQEIAEELALSPLTVKNHVQKILKKLKAKSRTHAVIHAINIGLLSHK